MRIHFVGLSLVSLVFVTACGPDKPAGAPGPASSTSLPSTDSTPPVATPSTSASAAAGATPTERVEEGGLRITDLTVGQGKEAKSGDTIVVHYTGKLEDGYVFDSSHKRNKPFDVKIGVGRVIKGWDRGIVGMREGGKRKLVIPHPLAYGEDGTGKIPPRSTLTFEVDLLEVK